jgi:hypothetical protein
MSPETRPVSKTEDQLFRKLYGKDFVSIGRTIPYISHSSFISGEITIAKIKGIASIEVISSKPPESNNRFLKTVLDSVIESNIVSRKDIETRFETMPKEKEAKDYGTEIKKRRLSLRLKSGELAKSLNLHSSIIDSGIERGIFFGRQEDLSALLTKLDYSPDEIGEILEVYQQESALRLAKAS